MPAARARIALELVHPSLGIDLPAATEPGGPHDPGQLPPLRVECNHSGVLVGGEHSLIPIWRVDPGDVQSPDPLKRGHFLSTVQQAPVVGHERAPQLSVAVNHPVDTAICHRTNGSTSGGTKWRRWVSSGAMKLHLMDGTYELFRSHFGSPTADQPVRPGGRWRLRDHLVDAVAAQRVGRHSSGRCIRYGHRVVPQRGVRRLQDGGGHRCCAPRPVPACGASSRGPRGEGVADGRVRGGRCVGNRGLALGERSRPGGRAHPGQGPGPVLREPQDRRLRPSQPGIHRP